MLRASEAALSRACGRADGGKVAVVGVVAEEAAQVARQLHLEAAQQPRQRPDGTHSMSAQWSVAFLNIH